MKNIQLSFGMSELLVVFSFLMFSTSMWFSIVAFVFGILGKLSVLAMEMSRKEEEEKKLNQTFDKLGNVITEVISNAGSGKKSTNSFH
tara:strand:- start:60 stop:323 length:264 start_codon:yes stop_codon:yes gene_type:complete